MERLCYRDIEMDPQTLQVWQGGRTVALTPKEAALLAVLIRHRGRTIPRSRLLVLVWGAPAALQTRTVDVHIHGLRQKLGLGQALVTVFRVGYRLED